MEQPTLRKIKKGEMLNQGWDLNKRRQNCGPFSVKGAGRLHPQVDGQLVPSGLEKY